jgi:prolyl-tRNA synthetase
VRWSKAFIPTLKETPADAEIISHQLMLRAGYIRQLMAGAYTYLPLGWRSIRKIEQIIREEMDRIGAIELFMPALQPIGLFERTGRKTAFGNVLINFRVTRGGSEAHLALGPTHEEVVTDLMARHISSYRELPLTVYQIQTKFRNEERPRFGVLRTSEFIMKDAYSFSTNIQQLDDIYQAMYTAYCRVFARCGLNYVPVEAESGPIGGDSSHEFMVPANAGEDKLIRSTTGAYAANIERAETGRKPAPIETSPDARPMQQVETPNAGSIEAVCRMLKCTPQQMIKTLVYSADDQPVAVLIRGDHEANDAKIRRALGARSVALADESTIRKVTGAPTGFAGPVGIRCRVIADHDVPRIANAITGANAADAHLIHVNVGRDYNLDTTHDLRMAVAGDPCPRSNGTLEIVHGVEVGHVFKLGTKYSDSLDATFLDDHGQRHPIIMGCYGIGVNRILACLAETESDANGLVLPLSVAPYEVLVIPLNVQSSEVMGIADRVYAALQTAGVEVLLDDRDHRPGSKFKDADLIGVPLRVVIGEKGLKDSVVELKWRTQATADRIPVSEIETEVQSRLVRRREEEAARVPAAK